MKFKLQNPSFFKTGWGLKQAMRVIKISIVLVLATCFQVSAKSYAQMVSINASEMSLEKICMEIHRQTGYNFFYKDDCIGEAKKVTVNLQNVPLTDALDACLKGQPISYKITGKTIVLTSKEVIDQQPVKNTIKGKVTNTKGEPLIGANILIKGTIKGTTTDLNGNYSINVPENAVLVFTFISYAKQEVAISGKREINIAMKAEDSSLDEVQIIAYGTTTKRMSTGNISSVKAADIEKQPVNNPLLALQGRVPGLEISQVTGINGGAVKVKIQGINSIGSIEGSLVKTGSDPLIVIDCVPFPNQLIGSFWQEGLLGGGSPLNFINPNDIESIDVLKDADATAIYGSRAANGAILITTKKGKAGKAKISLNLQQGYGKVFNEVEMLNTRQYLDMRYEAYKNNGINPLNLSTNAFSYDLKLWDTTRYTNWQKEFLGGVAQYTNINANVSGGTSELQYLIGGSYNRQTTVFPGDFDNQMAGMHFNVNSNSFDNKLKIQLTGSYSFNNNNLPGIDLTQQAILLAPNAPALYNADGTLNWAPTAAGASSWVNPLAANVVGAGFESTTKTLICNLNVSYQILKGLEIKSNFGFTNLNSDLKSFTLLEAYRPEQRANSTRSAAFGEREMSTWITEPQLEYKTIIGKGKLDALIGTTIQKSKEKHLAISGKGQPNDLLLNSLTAATSVTVMNSQTSIFRFNGLFGRLNYNWKDKYLVNLSGRRDGSNKFGDKNKFHNFASIGLGWIFSEETWIKKPIPFLSFGKLRASYGTTGNDQIPEFSYLSLYYVNPYAEIPYQNSLGMKVSGIANPYLQWELTEKLQGGIDLGFFNDRILIGITYALNRSSNQLTSYDLPDITGFSTITKNLPATVQNTSWEFTLNTINFRRNNFNWTSSFNLTVPRNKLVSFPGIESTPYASGERGLIVGQPLGVVKVYTYSGVDPATGSYQLLDKEGKPTNSSYYAEKNVLISTLPTSYGGLINTLSYKGFQLDFLLQFTVKKGRRDLYYNNGSSTSYGPGFFISGTSMVANQPVTVLDRWQKAGDQTTIAKYSSSMYSNVLPLLSDAQYSYAAGSYLRLKNLSLSWQLPGSWLQKTGLSATRIYFSGQNLYTLTKYPGLDPETGSSNLPPLQIWTIGLKLEL